MTARIAPPLVATLITLGPSERPNMSPLAPTVCAERTEP